MTNKRLNNSVELSNYNDDHVYKESDNLLSNNETINKNNEFEKVDEYYKRYETSTLQEAEINESEGSDDSDYDDPSLPDDQRPAMYLRQKVYMTLFLTIIGVIFGITGVATLLTEGKKVSIPFFVLAGLSFIPGFYHGAILYFAWRGYKGYSYSQVPSIKL